MRCSDGNQDRKGFDTYGGGSGGGESKSTSSLDDAEASGDPRLTERDLGGEAQAHCLRSIGLRF